MGGVMQDCQLVPWRRLSSAQYPHGTNKLREYFVGSRSRSHPSGMSTEYSARSLDDAQDLLAEGIFRSLLGGVSEIISTTDGLAKTQDALLATSQALLEELRLHDTAHQAGVINGRVDKMRQTSEALMRIAERLEALRRRADILEAELEADGCVAGNNLGELRL